MRNAFKVNFNDLPPEDTFDGLGIRRLGLTAEHATSKNLDVLNHGTMKPGLRLPWFLHDDRDEIIVVTKGTALMHIDGAEAISLGEGDVLCVPAKTRHSLENVGDSDFEGIFLKVFV